MLQKRQCRLHRPGADHQPGLASLRLVGTFLAQVVQASAGDEAVALELVLDALVLDVYIGTMSSACKSVCSANSWGTRASFSSAMHIKAPVLTTFVMLVTILIALVLMMFLPASGFAEIAVQQRHHHRRHLEEDMRAAVQAAPAVEVKAALLAEVAPLCLGACESAGMQRMCWKHSL